MVIGREKWPILRTLYSAHDPTTFLGHCTIDNYIRWSEKESQNNIVFYSLNGDWSDGTFVVIVRWCIIELSLNWRVSSLPGSLLYIRKHTGQIKRARIKVTTTYWLFKRFHFLYYIGKGLSFCLGCPTREKHKNWKWFGNAILPFTARNGNGIWKPVWFNYSLTHANYVEHILTELQKGLLWNM